MSEKILLTGATGFIGRNFLKSLNDMGMQTDIIARRNNIENLAQYNSISDIIETPDLFMQDSDWWEKICRNYSTIVHLAWFTEPGIYLNSDKNLDCLIGSLSLIKGAKRAGVKKFVAAGTCLEYQIENKKLSVSNTPLNPNTLYGASKLALFYSLSQLFCTTKNNFLWCRFFYLLPNRLDKIIYSSNQRLGDYIKSRIIKNEPVFLTNGNQIRDYLYVKDATDIMLNAIIHNKTGAINICSGNPRTVREIAEEIAMDFGKKDLLNFGTIAIQSNEPHYIVGEPEFL